MWTNQRFPNKNNLLIVDDKDCVFNKKLGNYNNAVYTLKTKAKISQTSDVFQVLVQKQCGQSKCLCQQILLQSLMI